MICPQCKKEEIKFSKEEHNRKNNIIIRKRYCKKCEILFTTQEKIYFRKERKPRNDTLWKNYRFATYGIHRLLAALIGNQKMIKDVKKINEFEKIKDSLEFGSYRKKGGKTGVYWKKENEKTVHELKIEEKKKNN